MTRALALLDRGLRIFAALLLAFMTALVLAQVILRYTGAGVPAYIEELARAAMVWMTLFIAAVAVHEGSHIRIDLVPETARERLPALWWALENLIDLISLTAFLSLVWYGIEMVSFAATQRSEGMRVPLSYPYAALPVAFAIAVLFTIARIAARRRG